MPTGGKKGSSHQPQQEAGQDGEVKSPLKSLELHFKNFLENQENNFNVFRR